MFLLYVDASGNTGDEHVIVAGLLVHERDVWDLRQAVESISLRLPLPATGAEIHADHMRTGRKAPWRKVPKEIRAAALEASGRLIAEPARSGIDSRLAFATIVSMEPAGSDPLERGFEDVFARCDRFLRMQPSVDSAHQCLAIADREGRSERRLTQLAHDWRTVGRGSLDPADPMSSYADLPLFVDSETSRPIQLADVIAHSVYRSVAHDDLEMFNIIRSSFNHGPHAPSGLGHLNAPAGCGCPACGSR